MRLIRVGAEAAVSIDLVVLVIPFEPDHLAVSLEGQHVRRDAIEEPAVVADDDGAASEIEQRLFECPQRIDVEVIGRLVEEEQVGAPLEQLREVHAIAFTARQLPHLALLVAPLEVEPGHVGPRGHLAVAERHHVVAAGDLFPHALVRLELA